MTIGGLPSDRQKGWLGLVASAVERPLGHRPREPAQPRRAGLGDDVRAPARQSGPDPRRHHRDLRRPGGRAHEGPVPAAGIGDAGARGRAGDMARRRRRFHRRPCIAWAMAATPTSCTDWARCMRRASAWRATRPRPSDWYRKGAAAGNVHAMTELAGALLEGRGVEKNAPEAVRLLRTAADKDQPEAMHRLGRLVARWQGHRQERRGGRALPHQGRQCRHTRRRWSRSA